jgi:hypothetical protein
MSSNQETKLFAVRFIQEGKQLRSETPVQGITFRPSNKGAQPAAGETWLCSRGFRPEGAQFRYVICKQQVVDGATATQVADGNGADTLTSELHPTGVNSTPAARVNSTAERAGGENKHSSRNRKSRHDRHEHKQQAPGVGSSNTATGTQGTTAPAAQSTTGNHKQLAGGATTKGDHHRQQGRKSRDNNHDQRKPQDPRYWATSGSAAPSNDRQRPDRRSFLGAFNRAKLILQPALTGRVDIANLRFAVGQRAAQTDKRCIELRARIEAEVRNIDQIAADPKLESAMEEMLILDTEKGRWVAESLDRARKELARLEGENAALNSERLRVLGKEGKDIKALGANVSSERQAAYEALKAGFAERQAPLTLSLQELKVKIGGTKEERHNDGLERQLMEFIEPFFSDWSEAKKKIDSMLASMEFVSTVYASREQSYKSLVESVFEYDKRLNQLG